MVAQIDHDEAVDRIIEALARRLEKGSGFTPSQKRPGWGYMERHTSPAGTPSTPYLHGPGGLFGVEGVERDVFSTHIAPQGLLSVLPARGSVYTDPLYGYITGFQAAAGSEATNVCDDPPTAGAIKGCLQTAQFGRYSRMTRETEVNRIGQRISRGEFDDLLLMNSPVLADGAFTPTSLRGDLSLAARAEMMARMMELGVAFERLLADQLWTGAPANNTAGDGYKEFPGFETLVSTGKVDALTGTTCPSLDSDVKNFQFQSVDGGTPNLVEVLTYAWRYVKHNASRMGFDPVQWAAVMREECFFELTSVWPCQYNTYRCTAILGNTAETLTLDSMAMRAQVDAMRAGKYLLIDGVQVPVITDDGIPELSSGDNGNIPIGDFASDIYLIPLTVRGGRPVTLLEYLDYSQGAIQGIQDGKAGEFFWTDGGRFLWHSKPPTNWCIQLISKIEPRLILLTPHLAARIQNVVYSPLQHTRQPLPTDDYFVNGGVTTARAAPSHYSDWNLP